MNRKREAEDYGFATIHHCSRPRDKANIFQTIIIILTYEHNSLLKFIFIIHASVIRDDD